MASKKEVKVPAPSVPTGKVEAVKVEAGKVESKPTSLADKLAGFSSKRGKSKSPVQDIKEPVPGIVERLRKLHAELEDAKAKYAEASQELISAVQPKYRQYVRAVQYVSSVHVTDGTEDLLVMWKDQYSKIPLEVRAEIAKVVGEQDFGTWFKTAAEVKLTSTDEKVIEKVLDLLQKSGLVEHVSIEGFIKPTTKFTEDRFKAFNDDQNGQLDPLVAQYKPSVRIR